MEFLSTRKVAARIRVGTLPQYSPGGRVTCACHPEARRDAGATEALDFWSKGDKVWCKAARGYRPALAVHEALGITIDTRL